MDFFGRVTTYPLGRKGRVGYYVEGESGEWIILLTDDWPDQSKSASVIPLHVVAFLSPTNPASYSTIKVSIPEKHGLYR